MNDEKRHGFGRTKRWRDPLKTIAQVGLNAFAFVFQGEE